MRKAVLIPDSFKGTMSSARIISIMKERILHYHPECTVVSIPVADGGEGSVDSFLTALGGERIALRTKGPWNEEIESFYGMLPDGTAVIEMAASAGLPQVGDRKDPSRTTTYGVGELILDAARRGAKRLVIGLGGSATNDAGCGAAAACGVTFLDKDGNAFIPVGGTLDRIAHIDTSTMDGSVKALPITAMCDIDNPFYGPTGAAAVFGPQKGADPEMVKTLDDKMKALSSLIGRELGIDLQSIPGSGAAGGMGGGMKAFFSAEMRMGIDAVLDITGFETLAKGADVIFTGEGMLIGGAGAIVGLVLGIGICWLQQRYGVVEIPAETFIVKAYPVEMRFGDILTIIVSLAAITFVISRLTVYSMIRRGETAQDTMA